MTDTPPSLGILMLKTRFPRILGDIGNSQTWPFPVHYQVIDGATVGRVVNAEPPVELLDAFVDASQQMIDAGAVAITTSCGFMVPFQVELSQRLPVPVMTSSLLQIPMVQASLPADKKVGVITINAEQLTSTHLTAAGAAADTPVIGVKADSELYRVIHRDLTMLNVAAAKDSVVAAGEELLTQAPDIGAIVLECTNMAPYANALRDKFGLPVYDIVSLINWWHGGFINRA